MNRADGHTACSINLKLVRYYFTDVDNFVLSQNFSSYSFGVAYIYFYSSGRY